MGCSEKFLARVVFDDSAEGDEALPPDSDLLWDEAMEEAIRDAPPCLEGDGDLTILRDVPDGAVIHPEAPEMH